MRLTLRPEWRLRPRPLNSVLGFMDIKTGATVVIMFALINKVAGLYGLIAIFHGGSAAQVTMYMYSVAALAAFAWGMKVVTEEDPRKTLYFAHVFLGDHLLNTIWTAFFAIAWWVYNPHDGKRIANSDAQKSMMDMGGPQMSDEERRLAAQMIWNKEKGIAATALVVGWCFKIYFAALLYSYAAHLRKGSYRSLPLTDSATLATSSTGHLRTGGPFGSLSTSALAFADEYELGPNDEEAIRTNHNPPPPNNRTSSTHSSRASQSLPRDRRTNINGPSKLGPSANSVNHAKIVRDLEAPTENVLWDEDDEGAEAVRGARGETDSVSDADGDIGQSAKRSRV